MNKKLKNEIRMVIAKDMNVTMKQVTLLESSGNIMVANENGFYVEKFSFNICYNRLESKGYCIIAERLQSTKTIVVYGIEKAEAYDNFQI